MVKSTPCGGEEGAARKPLCAKLLLLSVARFGENFPFGGKITFMWEFLAKSLLSTQRIL
jgi:hypothetical protein